MDVLHITKTENIPSIMKNGICRSKPLLRQYNEVMERDYGKAYDKNKGLVFGIPEGVDKRDKYIKDFFYWKTWGDKRNIFLNDFDDEQFYKYNEIGPKSFSHIKITPIQFSVLLIDIPYELLYDKYVHVQSTDMNNIWSDMDIRFEHDDKPLVLINYDIKSTRIKKVIATGESMICRRNKINVSLKI